MKSSETWYNNWSRVSVLALSGESAVARGDSVSVDGQRGWEEQKPWQKLEVNTDCHHSGIQLPLAQGWTAIWISQFAHKWFHFSSKPDLILFNRQTSQSVFSDLFPGCPHIWKGRDIIRERGKKNNTTVIKSNQSSTSQYENTSVWLQGVTHQVNNETTNELICYSPSCGEIPHTGQ